MALWQVVCDVAEIDENGLREFDLNGVKLLVARSRDELFVYPLRCPHMDEPLSNGICDGVSLTCSFHLWQWDMRSGQSTGEAEIDLLIYPSRIENGKLFVDMEKTLEYD